MNDTLIHWRLAAIAFLLTNVCFVAALQADDADARAVEIKAKLSTYCSDCHCRETSEGGFAMEDLGTDLTQQATFARWERIFDRVRNREMPPSDAPPIAEDQFDGIVRGMNAGLTSAHAASKATVLRRLNRREYQNTLNALFGTQLDLESMLPEDGRSHEFDNVGQSLGLSMVHMQKYLDAVNRVLDTAIEQTLEKPEAELQSFTFGETDEAKTLMDKHYKLLDDQSVVMFTSGNYPSGRSRPFSTKVSGTHRIRVTGYAYQSERPITFALSAEGGGRDSRTVPLGYHQMPPGRPNTIQVQAYLDARSMVMIEPEGLYDQDYQLRKVGPDQYAGPGLAISRIEIEGPIVDEFPSQGHRFVFGKLERRAKPTPDWAKGKSWYRPEFEVVLNEGQSSVRAELSRIAQAAFRRPVSSAEVDDFVALYEARVQEGDSVEQSLRSAISAIFCSPEFLYLRETPGPLDAYALAARLSYFLTRSPPDADLLAIAEQGTLATDPKVLLGQTNRLIRSPDFKRFVTDFTDAWLDLREIDFTNPDEKLFPEFDQFLKDSMLAQTRLFVAALFQENLPVRTLVKSDFAMLNQRLAEHYGIDGVEHSEVRKVPLASDSPRSGLLGQGAILKVSANGTNTSPVVRGVWVMERLLGTPTQPPPPGIPGVEPDIRGATSLRELLAKHRNLDSCNGCHRVIDPPGFALENFDPIGSWRERFRSLGEGEKISDQVKGRRVQYRLAGPVDASGELDCGVKFSGFDEFRDWLVTQEDLIAKSLVTKLLTFGTGREMGFSDRAAIDEIVAKSKRSDHRVGDLMILVLQSEMFRNK